mmetsp:Transcript_31416/g.79404  ORF Transcript_31416/g.79404 Transcript_31416/m.79404 type:complete len:294 (-) Transcript_31416:1272-2153(-)
MECHATTRMGERRPRSGWGPQTSRAISPPAALIARLRRGRIAARRLPPVIARGATPAVSAAGVPGWRRGTAPWVRTAPGRRVAWSSAPTIVAAASWRGRACRRRACSGCSSPARRGDVPAAATAATAGRRRRIGGSGGSLSPVSLLCWGRSGTSRRRRRNKGSSLLRLAPLHLLFTLPLLGSDGVQPGAPLCLFGAARLLLPTQRCLLCLETLLGLGEEPLLLLLSAPRNVTPLPLHLALHLPLDLHLLNTLSAGRLESGKFLCTARYDLRCEELAVLLHFAEARLLLYIQLP